MFQGRWLLLGLLALLMVGCQTQPYQVTRKIDTDGSMFGGSPCQGLSVGLQKTALGGDRLKLFLKNESGRPMTVYASFRVDRGGFDGNSDIFLIVREEETQVRASDNSARAPSGGHRHSDQNYRQLAPNEYIETTLEVSDYVRLQPGVSYLVVAEYDHQESGFTRNGQWIEMGAWTGRCASNPVRIKLPKR